MMLWWKTWQQLVFRKIKIGFKGQTKSSFWPQMPMRIHLHCLRSSRPFEGRNNSKEKVEQQLHWMTSQLIRSDTSSRQKSFLYQQKKISSETDSNGLVTFSNQFFDTFAKRKEERERERNGREIPGTILELTPTKQSRDHLSYNKTFKSHLVLKKVQTRESFWRSWP